MRMTRDRPGTTATLYKRHLLTIVLLPHVIYAIMVHGPLDAIKLPLAIVFFLPLSFYFMPPAIVAGGHGFVCQIGCGPISPLGYAVSLVFWTVVAFAVSAAEMAYKMHRRS